MTVYLEDMPKYKFSVPLVITRAPAAVILHRLPNFVRYLSIQRVISYQLWIINITICLNNRIIIYMYIS